MAKPKTGKRDIDSYTIKGTNKHVKVGDCVLLRPSDTDKPPYVARVESISADHRGGARVRVRWYYRPEESIGGRRLFHGAKELFLSDHYDIQSAHTIEGKCVVHSFKNYTKLENVGAEDYFCRFEYNASTGGFTPDRVAVYCKCEMPYNPDDLMIQCEECKDWFHPSCMGMSIEQAKGLDMFLCSDCSSENAERSPSPEAFPVPSVSEPKVTPQWCADYRLGERYGRQWFSHQQDAGPAYLPAKEPNHEMEESILEMKESDPDIEESDPELDNSNNEVPLRSASNEAIRKIEWKWVNDPRALPTLSASTLCPWIIFLDICHMDIYIMMNDSCHG